MRRSFAWILFGIVGSLAFAQVPYFVKADMVRAAQGAMGPVCVPNSVFFPGEMIVFRAVVLDGATGEELTFEDVQARGVEAVVKLEDHEDIPMFFPSEAQLAEELGEGEALPPGSTFFRGPWPIPADAPAGMYEWQIEVSDAEGNTATFLPIGQAMGANSVTIQPAD